MRRCRTALAAAAALCLALAGCAGGSDEPSGSTRTRSSTAVATPSRTAAHPSPSGASTSGASTSGASSTNAAGPVDLAGGRLVAFGDSYTAGTWTAATQPSPALFCAQAAHNYPRQVARALGMSLDDRSCNGARTGNVLTPQEFQGETAPAQIDGLTPDTRLVTIALGVNDNGLFGTLVGCSHYTAVSTSSAPCKDSVLASTPNAVSQIPGVTVSLVSAVRAIKTKAPQARVVLLGYPQVLPDGPQCPARWPITRGDATWVNETLSQLDDAIKTAAAQTGSTFFDLRSVTASHTVCAAEPWFNGSSVAGHDGATYHPRSGYMTGVAQALVASLTR